MFECIKNYKSWLKLQWDFVWINQQGGKKQKKASERLHREIIPAVSVVIAASSDDPKDQRWDTG